MVLQNSECEIRILLHLCLAGTLCRADPVVVVRRKGDGGKNGDDGYDDHQFDQREAVGVAIHGSYQMRVPGGNISKERAS